MPGSTQQQALECGAWLLVTGLRYRLPGEEALAVADLKLCQMIPTDCSAGPALTPSMQGWCAGVGDQHARAHTGASPRHVVAAALGLYAWSP
jgi:hypothetical protein